VSFRPVNQAQESLDRQNLYFRLVQKSGAPQGYDFIHRFGRRMGSGHLESVLQHQEQISIVAPKASVAALWEQKKRESENIVPLPTGGMIIEGTASSTSHLAFLMIAAYLTGPIVPSTSHFLISVHLTAHSAIAFSLLCAGDSHPYTRRFWFQRSGKHFSCNTRSVLKYQLYKTTTPSR
jgi:hypothetical protein